MVKFINPRTGRSSHFSRKTVELGLVPKGLLRDSQPRKLQDIAKPQQEEPAKEEPSSGEPTREQMIGFLRSKKIRVNPQIGNEKLKARYDENT